MIDFRKPPQMLVLPLDAPINEAIEWEYKRLETPTYLRKPQRKYERKRVEHKPAFVRRQAS